MSEYLFQRLRAPTLPTIDLKHMPKVVVINYADKHFRGQQRMSSLFARVFGGADDVVSYAHSDLDSDFVIKNRSILENERGGGYWLWKPYIIMKGLFSLNDGDYLFYQDSGSVLIRSLKHLVRSLAEKRTDVLTFELPLLEIQWTNSYTLQYFRANTDEILFSNQRLGGYVFMRKSDKSVNFIKEWFELCTNKDLLVDRDDEEHDLFKQHRHDQSILSLLAKKHNIPCDSDPSNRGRYLEGYYGHLIRKTRKNSYPTLIIANRGRNIFYYLFWFYCYYTPKMKVWMKLKKKKHFIYK